MTIIWHTKNINIQNYYKIIKRTIILNGDNGTNLSGYKAWQKFKDEWTLHIIPVTEQADFSRFYDHLLVETSSGIAWGVTGKNIIYMFVNDTINPFIIRQNAMPLSHELLHALYQFTVGTFHITRKYTSPEGRIGTSGAAATVIVHDNWYGRKQTFVMWISWGLGWLPITITYYPVKQAKKEYAI